MVVKEDSDRRLVVVEMTPAEYGAILGVWEGGQSDLWWGQVSAVDLLRGHVKGLKGIKITDKEGGA